MFGKPTAEASGKFDPELFLYITIPESVGPIDRGEQYEEPLDACLRKAGVGFVSGGGTLMGAAGADGTREISYGVVDVDASDRDGALAVLRRELATVGAPEETEINYRVNDRPLRDMWSAGDWQIGLSRTGTHPGFGW